jgi:hypothetical protein
MRFSRQLNAAKAALSGKDRQATSAPLQGQFIAPEEHDAHQPEPAGNTKE